MAEPQANETGASGLDDVGLEDGFRVLLFGGGCFVDGIPCLGAGIGRKS